MAVRRRPATTVNYPDGAGCGADRFSCSFWSTVELILLPDLPDFGVPVALELAQVAEEVFAVEFQLLRIENPRGLGLVHDPALSHPRFVHAAGFTNRGALFVGEGCLLDAGVGILLLQTFHRELERAFRGFRHGSEYSVSAEGPS
jgi:hypothetical protein